MITEKLLLKIEADTREAKRNIESLDKGIGDLVKNVKFDKLKGGFKDLAGEIGGTTKVLVDATAQGAEFGSAFGPMGAAIGGVAGAIKGMTMHILESEKAMDEQRKKIEEQGNAYWDVVHALERKKLVESSLADVTRQIAEYEGQRNESQITANRILNDTTDKYRQLSDQLLAYEGRLVNANEALRSGGGSAAEEQVLRATRAVRDVRLELDALDKGYSSVRVTAEKEENARKDRIEDLGRALGQQGLSQKTNNELLKEYNTLVRGTTKADEDRAKELAKLGKALLGGESPSQRAIREGAADRAARQADIERAVDGEERFDDLLSRMRESAIETANGVKESIAELESSAVAAASARRTSLIEAVFGPIEEVDLYKQSFTDLGRVFTAFSDAVGSSYEAIVTGQGSVSQAFKKMFADGLLAMGKSSAIEALRETALGFGSLALGPLGGASASMHFQSAAMHAGVAVAAGVAAHALGAGGGASTGAAGVSGGGSSSSSASNSGGFSGQQQGPGERVIVVMGDSFSSDSPRMRQLQAERAVNLAFGEDGVTHK